MPVNRGLRERSLRMSQWLKGSGAKGSLFKGTYPTAGLFECSVDSYLTGKFVLTEDLFVTHLKMIFKNIHRCRYGVLCSKEITNPSSAQIEASLQVLVLFVVA